jgi:hypothetical protein
LFRGLDRAEGGWEEGVGVNGGAEVVLGAGPVGAIAASPSSNLLLAA